MAKTTYATVTVCPKRFDLKNYGKMKLPHRKPWTEEDWLIHEPIFTRLAQPRKKSEALKDIQLIRPKMPLKQLMPRIRQLAQPKK